MRKNKFDLLSEEQKMFVRMQAREKSRMYYHNNKEALLKRRKERVNEKTVEENIY